MKKIIIIVLVLVLIKSNIAYAVITPTKTPAPTVEQDKTLEKIKDLVASKVAELKLVDKRGIVGSVKSASNNDIAITDYKNMTRQIDIDELTKFESSDKDSFGISDIKPGDVISTIGLFNKDTKRLLARFISLATNIPQNVEGVVVATDAKAFILTIITSDGKKKTVSVESSTKTLSLDNADTVKSGFSKIKEEQRIIVVGFADPKVKDQLNATRIIHFLSIPPSDQMKKLESSLSEKVPVSTGSAGKVAPIVK